MAKFCVTYERFFPHDEGEDICEADESGFEVQYVPLRHAIEVCGGLHANYEANEWPVTEPRWFTNYGYNEGTGEYFEHGINESRSLHIPKEVTPASRRRIARLLGVAIRS